MLARPTDEVGHFYWVVCVFTEEALGVFSATSRFVDGTNGIIVGKRGAVVVDCSNYVDEGKAMADFIRERGYATNDIVMTHGHGDHIYGAEPLKSGQVVNIEDRFGLL